MHGLERMVKDGSWISWFFENTTLSIDYVVTFRVLIEESYLKCKGLDCCFVFMRTEIDEKVTCNVFMRDGISNFLL